MLHIRNIMEDTTITIQRGHLLHLSLPLMMVLLTNSSNQMTTIQKLKAFSAEKVLLLRARMDIQE